MTTDYFQQLGADTAECSHLHFGIPPVIFNQFLTRNPRVPQFFSFLRNVIISIFLEMTEKTKIV